MAQTFQNQSGYTTQFQTREDDEFDDTPTNMLNLHSVLHGFTPQFIPLFPYETEHQQNGYAETVQTTTPLIPYAPDRRRYPDSIEHVLVPIYPEYCVKDQLQPAQRSDVITVHTYRPPKQAHPQRPQDHTHQESTTEHNVTEGNIQLLSVMLAFTNGQYVQSRSSWKNWMAWITEKTTGEFIHVEMVFKIYKTAEKQHSYICCTIYYGEPVKWEEKKAYDRVKNKWVIYAIKCTDDEMHQLYTFCDSQIGKQFNKMAFYLNFIPVWGLGWLRWDTHGSKWLCSELVLSALQSVFQDLRAYTPCKTTVTELMKIVSSHGMFIIDPLMSYEEFTQRIQYTLP